MSRRDELEEELYCPICGDMFQDPLMLQCTHSFCAGCLQEQIKKGQVTIKSANVMFDCPVCRKTVTLDEHGLGGLPKNRLLQKMVDSYKGRRRRKTVDERCLGYCEEHSRRELGAFCSTCHDIVCIDCVVGRHKNHAIESVDDVYSKKRKSLEGQVSAIEGELHVLGSAEAEEYRYMEQIKKQCQEKSAALELQFDEYIGLLQQSKDSVLSELASRQDQEIATVHHTLDVIHARQASLEDTMATLKQKLKIDMASMLKEDTEKVSSEHAEHSRSKKGHRSSRKETDIIKPGPPKSPRSKCFGDCSLEIDSAGLETIINSAHINWETQTDLYSPKHMADRYSELFEKEWKTTFTESSPRPKDDMVTQLIAILMEAYQQAEKSCEAHLESLTYHMLQQDIDVQVGNCSIRGVNKTEESTDSAAFCGVKEGLRKLRALHAEALARDTVFMVHHEIGQLSASLGNGCHRQLSVYANRCFELCFLLQLQDPPLYIQTDMDLDMAAETEKDNYKFVKRKGRKSKIIVWPPLHLYKGGPMIAKGVVFMPMTAASM